MAGKRVLVIGGNFGGLTAALELKHELGEDVDVTVVSASDRFLFNPSLIWLPFGKRNAADITFALEPTFDAHRIEFVHAEATAIDPAARTVTTTSQSYGYDYLVIATGCARPMPPLAARDGPSLARRPAEMPIRASLPRNVPPSGECQVPVPGRHLATIPLANPLASNLQEALSAFGKGL
jgi:NADPH-dependent 2,4-dienoyl-CoA reductase/sulfur reductase-like enzyme